MNMTADTTMRSLLAACAIAVLAACGGGDKASEASAPPLGASVKPTSDAEAVRFLQQATFGATAADIARVKQIGYENWIVEQFAIPRSSHLEFLTTQVPLPIPANTQVSSAPLYYSFWRQALAAPDQLRQRAAFTLSQILVTSAAEAQLSNDADDAHGLAAYLDILSEHTFGNYRDILQSVSTFPTMGVYLTSLGNRGDNGRTPDENYAREVMQLFTIGLFELNMDGTQKMVNGQPVETYDMEDIRNLAKVFTGWSWGNQGAPDPSNTRFGGGGTQDPMRRVIPMQFYPQYHSPDAKTFLSVTIPAGTNGVEAMRTALDTLFAHPNIAPFIAKQYIQRMVTSNPSPAYVQAVAQAFAAGSYTTAGTDRTFGSGRRGDLRAVVAATLLHPEARTAAASVDAGKLREPILRLATLLRSFEATSQTGNWRIGDTDASLFQTPMKAPSVFNYFRPGYVPPNTTIASKSGLVAPEFQIAHEVSVATYANTMQNWVPNGLGTVPANSGLTGTDVRPLYTTARGLAPNADQLADHLNLMLTANSLDATTRNTIRDAIASIPAGATNAAANRVNLGVFMTMMTPEFLVQK
jgi:uncharacterized protein (DUF1800 family)